MPLACLQEDDETNYTLASNIPTYEVGIFLIPYVDLPTVRTLDSLVLKVRGLVLRFVHIQSRIYSHAGFWTGDENPSHRFSFPLD